LNVAYRVRRPRAIISALRTAFLEYWGSGNRDCSPGLEWLVDYWIRYRAALAVLGAVVTVILIGMSVVSWKRHARTGPSERHIRHVLGLAGASSVLLALAVIVVIVANAGTTVNPAPALLAFFNDGAGGP
jgi:hypothetical protein